MANQNPFPDSEQKAYLRRHHLAQYFAPYRDRAERDLRYFGLPSAGMYDVEMWRRTLGQVTAVEKYPDIALSMYRTTIRLGIRDKTIVLEMDICEAARLLALDEPDIELSLASLSAPMASSIRKARKFGYDIVNVDPCGGFLYPTQQGTSEYEKMLRALIAYQARQGTPFYLILNFSTRDTGKADYDSFIAETLRFLQATGTNTAEIARFYSAGHVQGQSPNLRRLRFCVPTYIHKISHEHFEVRSLGAWYYKTFYHTVLFFELRHHQGMLGPWPPPDEIKGLLRTPLKHIQLHNGDVSLVDLEGPELP